MNLKNKEFSKTQDIYLKVWYLHPYKQFSELVNESINLEYSMVSGNVKLETAGTARKDRYTSCSYGGYFISLLDQDLLKETRNQDFSQYMIIPDNFSDHEDTYSFN